MAATKAPSWPTPRRAVSGSNGPRSSRVYVPLRAGGPSNDRPSGSDLNERNGGNRLPDENGRRACEIDGALEDQHWPAISPSRGLHSRQDRKCAVGGEVG